MTTPANQFGGAAPHTDEWLKGQCNRYVNGYCGTLACLKRGGYGGAGMKVDYECATCEPHEILKELQRLRVQENTRAHMHQFVADFYG